MSRVVIRSIRIGPEQLRVLHFAQPDRYPALFESAARGGKLGRYDILFAYPQGSLLKNRDGRLFCDDAPVLGESFLDALNSDWGQSQAASIDSQLPFTGGWVVFLGYETAGEIEFSLKLPVAAESISALALRVPAAVVYDHLENRAQLVVESEYSALLDDIERDLASSFPVPEMEVAALPLTIEEDEPAVYLSSVEHAKNYIKAGDIYQANLSRGWSVRLPPDWTPRNVYARLRLSNPAPFAASFQWNDLAILSSSPERLFEVRNGEISTRPIAGTRPRSRDPGADAGETSLLIDHPKERAEHVMLIDLERNDLGRICTPGSVQVDEFMALESYEHVHHIVSNVRGRLLPGTTPGQVLRAVFPGGTITGCPKVRCMQIIAELENVGRGAYTGSLGYLNRDGSGDFNILIRTLVMQGRELSFRAGAGIVADSDPPRELEETRAKAKGMLRAFASL